MICLVVGFLLVLKFRLISMVDACYVCNAIDIVPIFYSFLFLFHFLSFFSKTQITFLSDSVAIEIHTSRKMCIQTNTINTIHTHTHTLTRKTCTFRAYRTYSCSLNVKTFDVFHNSDVFSYIYWMASHFTSFHFAVKRVDLYEPVTIIFPMHYYHGMRTI